MHHQNSSQSSASGKPTPVASNVVVPTAATSLDRAATTNVLKQLVQLTGPETYYKQGKPSNCLASPDIHHGKAPPGQAAHQLAAIYGPQGMTAAMPSSATRPQSKQSPHGSPCQQRAIDP